MTLKLCRCLGHLLYLLIRSIFRVQHCFVSEAFPPTILTLRAWGRFDSNIWTQSGAPSPYLAFRAPPAFKLYMVLKACPAFNPYLAFRAPLCSEALNTKFGPAFNTKYTGTFSKDVFSKMCAQFHFGTFKPYR